MDERQLLGSTTAKNGFKNEDDIVFKFNNWQTDFEAKAWLEIMQYKLSEIEYVIAEKLSGYKTDVQVQIRIKLKKLIDTQNLQVKLVSIKKGFNQIDKRWTDKYSEMWNMPNNIINILKRYTGEIEPNVKSTKDKRRMLLYEFDEKEQNELKNWLQNNKTLIIADILKGRGQFSAEWILVAQKTQQNSRWTLKSINHYLNHYGNGDVTFTKQGNIRIGRIGIQRKGGDGGRKTANMLQFKIDPTELFEI